MGEINLSPSIPSLSTALPTSLSASPLISNNSTLTDSILVPSYISPPDKNTTPTRTYAYYIALIIDIIMIIILGIFLWKITWRNSTEPFIDLNIYSYRLIITRNINPLSSQYDSSYETIKVFNLDYRFLIILTIILFAVSILFDIFYATDGFGSGAYSAAIKNSNNYFRWIEYIITIGIMIFIISSLAGVKDYDANVLLLVLVAVIMVESNSTEVYASTQQNIYTSSQKDKDNYPSLYDPSTYQPNLLYGILSTGAIKFILTSTLFYIILKDFLIQAVDIGRSGFIPPDVLYALVIPVLLVITSIGFIQLFQLYLGGQYLYYDIGYLIVILITRVYMAFLLMRGYYMVL